MKKIIAFVLIVIFLSGCKEETIIGPKGNIVGFVKLLDEKGIEIQDKSGIKVVLDENHTVLTNTIGRFEFQDIESGTYQLHFEKEGFGTVKKFNYLFAPGNVPGVISETHLIALPNITMIDKQVESVFGSPTAVQIKGTISSTNSYTFIYYFVDRSDADASDYLSSYSYTYCCGDVTTFDHYIYIPESLPSPLYITCYAASTANNQGQYNYYDYEKGKAINPTIKKLFSPVKIK